MEIREPSSAKELHAALSITDDAWREAFSPIVGEEAFEAVEPPDDPDGLDDRYLGILGMDDGVSLVAADHGTIVGWSSLIWDRNLTREYVDEDEAEIRTLYVHPDRWGEGVGTWLLEAGLDRVPEPTTAVVLETFEANEMGRSFYESRGFTKRGSTAFEIAEDSYPSVIYERGL